MPFDSPSVRAPSGSDSSFEPRQPEADLEHGLWRPALSELQKSLRGSPSLCLYDLGPDAAMSDPRAIITLPQERPSRPPKECLSCRRLRGQFAERMDVFTDADLPCPSGACALRRGRNKPLRHIWGVARRSSGAVACVEVTRPHDGPRFDSGDSTTLRGLLPLYSALLEADRQVLRLRSERDAVASLLAQVDLGAVFVDARFEVIGANAEAKAALADGDGLSLGPYGLIAGRHAETLQLRGLLGRALRGERPGEAEPPAIMRVTRRSGRGPLQLVVAPAAGAQAQGPFGCATAMVVIADPERAPRLDAKALALCYGLTPAEARIAEMAAGGVQPEAAARELRIALGTSRTHLKRILSKMGAARQAELVSMLLRSAARLSAPQSPRSKLIGTRKAN